MMIQQNYSLEKIPPGNRDIVANPWPIFILVLATQITLLSDPWLKEKFSELKQRHLVVVFWSNCEDPFH